MKKEFWKGANFWVSLTLLILGVTTAAITPGEIAPIVAGVSGLIAGVFAVREKLKTAKLDVVGWLKSANTWNYLASVVIAIFPTVSPELFVKLNELTVAILGGNWQGIVGSLFSLATILYYIVRKPAPVPV